MPAPQAILDLVARFEEHRETYKSASYNETQVRRDFIDPFFRELGWDVDNKAGYAEAYRDVVHEDSVKVSGATKAPDYGFRIGGQRKFFLEAKKPSVSIKSDIGPAYQLRRYAWSAKLPISVLTDFEELAVYDCNKRPLPGDAASKGRILYYTFDHYAEKWDEIAGIFSKEAILKGSFDRFAVSAKGKRGTTAVDEEFLATIEEWRADLARNLAIRNPLLSQRELNFSVQRVIDRIIFLRICEDRGIEDYGRLRQATEEKGVIYPRLVQLFKQADARYNSGLFHFEEEKGRQESPDTLTPGLQVDDSTLKKIIRGLYYPESPYEFRVLSADILGSVYEQFLGKVIRLTESHQAKIEEKPEVKKAGGVYYTPTYIVDYIVKQTVGPLLEGKTPKQIERVHILDPACGSGSFLIGAYQFLLDWHQRYYSENEPEKWAKGKAPQIVASPGGGWELTIPERKRILTTHLYGVDLDSQAVEVTKLSLLLKVLEGETAQKLQRELIQERVLPDLGDNIKCGNSLIGSDYYTQPGLPEMGTEDHLRINVFDWDGKDGFSEIMKSGGFDAVIGNPPYGAYLQPEDKNYLIQKFPNQTYQLDTYLVFIEQSLSVLLRQGGNLGMITPNPWLTNLKQDKIRRFVLEKATLTEIVHFKFPVFPKVVVDTEIVLMTRGMKEDNEIRVAIFGSLNDFLGGSSEAIQIERKIHSQAKWSALGGDTINIFTNSDEEDLAKKIRAMAMPLKIYCDINVGIKPYQTGKGIPSQTKDTVKNRPFDSKYKESSHHQLYLRGRDINRYKIAPLEERYLKYGEWLAEPRPAARFDAPEKLFMRQTGDSLVAALDTNQFLCLNNMHVLVPNEQAPPVKLILGLLNSRLMNWFYHFMNPEVGEALAEVKKTNVAKLPIRNIKSASECDLNIHSKVVALVDQMLGLQKLHSEVTTPHEQTVIERQISAIDSQIDSLVYDLYGLTEEEIKLVEATA
jgi:type I restriction-modification system DNA methylase subunit